MTAMVEMFVYKVGIDVQGRTIVLLADTDTRRRVLPILVGFWEARAIAVEMEREELGPPERPMTHDLMASVIRELGHSLHQITVTKIEDHVFYALLSLVRGDERIEVDARPSDAIALAVRFKARILVSAAVLDEAEVTFEDDEDDDIGRFKQLLGDIDIDDPSPGGVSDDTG
jgi:uncharacterized protein